MALEDADKTAVKAMIADAIKPIADANKSLSDNLKVVADTLAADAKTKAEEKTKADAEAKTKADAEAKAKAEGKESTATGAAPITAEQIAKQIADGIAAAMKSQQDAAKSTAQRDGFIAEKLKGVPAVYQTRLGTDPTKWAAEEQAIRDQFKADLAASGATVKDVGGAAAGGATASDATADAKITAFKASGLSAGEAAMAVNLKLPG